MKAVPWLFATAFLVLLVLSVGEGQRVRAQGARVEDSLRQVAERATFARDTLKNANAQREVRDAKHADSLRQVIARFRRQSDVHRNRPDSIQVVAVVDSEPPIAIQDVLNLCAECADRLDSAVTASRLERTVSDTLVRALASQSVHYRERYDAERRNAARQKRLTWVALVGGIVAGAWLRGQ